MVDISARIAGESWLVLGQMAPYLLFGFLVAGILSVCISAAWVERHLGGRGLGPVLKASLFGVPLPLCSCGVIPVSVSIRRHGASRAATTSFLLSTPQTGVDSILITYALLGPVFAVFRPIAALATGLIGGALVQLLDLREAGNGASPSTAATCTQPCCEAAPSQPIVLRVLHYGFVTLPRDISVALLVGIVIAGAMATLVPGDQLKAYIGGGTLSILLMMAVGVPVYVCATASVPIAAGLMHMGASPGAALAFLIAGPATNAATFTTIWKVLGRRTAILYLVTVGISSVACGLALDSLVPAMEAAMPKLGTHVHAADAGGWTPHVGAVGLLLVLAYSSMPMSRLKKAQKSREDEKVASAPTDQQRLELLVSGMSCSHCAESVQRALAECDGVRWAEVDLAGGRAVVIGEHLELRQLVAIISELGYAATESG